MANEIKLVPKDELMHYGVVGMKWGHRKARQRGTEYTYQSRYTKKQARKAQIAKDSAAEWDEMARNAKAKGKIDKANKYKMNAQENRSQAKALQKRANRAAEFDKKMSDSVKNTSTGKTFVKVALGGFTGAKTYEAFKAEGNSKLVAAGGTFASTFVAGPFGNMAATSLARREYANRF